MMNFYKSEEEFYLKMVEKVKDIISTDKKSLCLQDLPVITDIVNF